MDKQVRSAQCPHLMLKADPRVYGLDAAGQKSRTFFRHSLYRLLDHIWLLVILAIIGGMLGIVMGYSMHNQVFEKEFSVNIGLRTDGMVSGHETAGSGVALLEGMTYAQKVRALLSFDMRLIDCQQAISITNPTETDVITFVVHASDPDKTRELAQAARAVADNVLSEMPQVGKLQWHDGQYEVRDVGRSLAAQTILVGLLAALVGLILGIVISFLLILFDTKIHFVDDEELPEELYPRTLLRRTIVKRYATDAGAFPGKHAKTSKLKKRRTNIFVRRYGRTSIRPAAPLSAQGETTDASIRLFASQTLLNMPESKMNEHRGAALLLLPTSPACDYTATFVSVIAAFSQMGERVLVADFTPDLVRNHANDLSSLPVDFLNLTPADSLKAYGEQVRSAISSYDITIVLFSEFSFSEKVLPFFEACEHIVPFVLLHKTRLLDFKRLINQILSFKKEIDRVAFIGSRDTDFKRSVL